jgi:cell wall-associated NlpC family hydrolase
MHPNGEEHNGKEHKGHIQQVDDHKFKEAPGDPQHDPHDPVPGPHPGDPPYATGEHPTLAGDPHDVPPMHVEHGSSDTARLTDNPPGYTGPAGPQRDAAWQTYLSHQNGTTSGTITPQTFLPNPDAVSDPGLKTVGAAARQQGVSYAWGAGHPDKAPIPGVTTGTLYGDPANGRAHQYGDGDRTGFDCSGLARFATYEGHNGLDISAGNEGNTVGQYRTLTDGGTKNLVDGVDLKPGDLIYYGREGHSHHVAIYAGNGLVIQAHQSGVPIEVSPMDQEEAHFNVHVGK